MPNIRVEPEERVCPICQAVFYVGGRGRPSYKRTFCSNQCAGKGRMRTTHINTLAARDAAYIAGLFDGEGSIIQWERGYGGRLALRATVSNTDFRIHEWLVEKVGAGSVVQHVHANPLHADSGTWQVNGHNAVAFLKQLLPYLILKKEHAEHAIATQEPPFPREFYQSPHPSTRVEQWRQRRSALRAAKATAGGSP